MLRRYKEEDVYDTRNHHTNFRNSRNRSIWNLVLDRCSICILLCRLVLQWLRQDSPEQKCRKYHHEESDGFLYRNGSVHFPGALIAAR